MKKNGHKVDCPPWCDHDHLGRADDLGGFHHDGPVATIPLSRAGDADLGAERLYVFVSQLVQADTGAGAVYVDLQDEHRSVLSLTASECVRLSEALQEAALVIGSQECAGAAIDLEFSVNA